MRLIPMFLVCLMPFAAAASPLLPDTLLRAIKADPARYIASVSTLIASYGGADGLTEAQLNTSMALMRAKARTQAILPLMGADLDADGALTRDEVVAAEDVASATARGKMEKAFGLADVDADGVVTAEELAGFGDAAALAAFSPAMMARLAVVMGFDADGDGKVTISEVRSGLGELTS